MLKDQKDVRAIVTSDQNSIKGANTRYELYLLEEYARKERLKALMESGVTVESIDSVFIDADSEVENDVYLGANTRIKGTSRIKSGAVLEGDSLIKDSTIHENVLLRLGSYVDQSEIEKEVTVGPFAQIRPHSHLGEGVRIGNFVETKACKMGKGSKANHLAYLGDVSIGANSNIGAGTIVCNYDGKNKNKTIIGDQVFVGSNSTLVAPVELESNTYVAAGSVVTAKVPTGSLAVGRSRQVNKDGWVTNKKS
jgi:bifunctional UDP-N-acetylglucosamine pyrophosphorylase/glucosamine-1-phosphate N-acetyltransferase